MNILGIDQSFTKCAYVLMENGVMTSFGIITSDKKEDIFKRAWTITQELMLFCLNRRIDEIHIEGLAFGMRGNATRDLAGLQFTITCALRFISDIDNLKILSPTTIKKFATGSGKADKNMMVAALPEVIRKTFEIRGFLPKKGLDDLADAYWIANYPEEQINK